MMQLVDEVRQLPLKHISISVPWNDMGLVGHVCQKPTDNISCRILPRIREIPRDLHYTISEPARREALTRLLQLNHQRYEEEVKLGLHDKKKKTTRRKSTKKKPKPKKPDGQLSLFD